MPPGFPDFWGKKQKINVETTLDIELLKKEVAQRFPFYDLKYNAKTAAFYCRIDQELLDKNFDNLRIALSEKGYIPMIRYERGEHIVYIMRKPKIKIKPTWINIVLFADRKSVV